MQGWSVVVLIIVLLVIFGFLCSISSSFLTLLTYMLKGSYYLVAIPLNILYVLLVYWWLAIIKKIKHEEAPRFLLFRKRG